MAQVIYVFMSHVGWPDEHEQFFITNFLSFLAMMWVKIKPTTIFVNKLPTFNCFLTFKFLISKYIFWVQ